MKRSGGEGAGGIGNGSFRVAMSLSASSTIGDNSSNRILLMQPSPESPTSRLGSLSLQEREREQQCVASTTTFVHVDTCNFREVVQKLTGASDHDGLEKFPVTLPARQAARAAAAAAGTDKLADITCKGLIPKPVGDLSARRPAFKLHERRQSFLLRKLEVKDLRLASGLRRGSCGYGSGLCSPTSELSPRFNPSLMPSPVTPLTSNVFDNNAYGPNTPNSHEVYASPRPSETQGQEPEEGTGRPTVETSDGRFLLHSSPILERPRQIPELLTLFPLTSPRVADPPS